MPRDIIFTGKKIQLAVENATMPDGSRVSREVVLHPGAVAILPMLDAQHICLVRNERYAVGETLLEIPAGTRKPAESAEATAIRELEEETGNRAAGWRKLAEFYPSPGILSEKMDLFLATELMAGQMNLDAGERLTPEVVNWSDAVKWALDGTIRDAKSLVGILLWDRLRQG